jgi:hypothetical protein
MVSSPLTLSLTSFLGQWSNTVCALESWTTILCTCDNSTVGCSDHLSCVNVTVRTYWCTYWIGVLHKSVISCVNVNQISHMHVSFGWVANVYASLGSWQVEFFTGLNLMSPAFGLDLFLATEMLNCTSLTSELRKSACTVEMHLPTWCCLLVIPLHFNQGRSCHFAFVESLGMLHECVFFLTGTTE